MNLGTLTPATVGGPVALVLGQPFLTGVERGLEAAFSRKVSTWTTAACRGASYGMAVGSLAAAVSTSITLLPAVAIGVGAGAAAGVAAKLLQHFYLHTAMGRRLAGWVTKVPSFIRKPIAWAAAVADWAFGRGPEIQSKVATGVLRRPLMAMLNVTSLPARIATTATLLVATRKVNRAGRGPSLLATAGAMSIAGAALAAPVLAAHTAIPMATLTLGTTIAVGVGVAALVTAAAIATFRGVRRLIKASKQAVAEVQQELAPEPVPAPAPEPAKPDVINVVDQQGTVTQVPMPTVEEVTTTPEPVAEPAVEQAPAEATKTLRLDQAARTRINAKVNARASHESISEQVTASTPTPMAADLYSQALDRRIADGMTPEEAVESMKPKSKRAARRARRAG